MQDWDQNPKFDIDFNLIIGSQKRMTNSHSKLCRPHDQICVNRKKTELAKSMHTFFCGENVAKKKYILHILRFVEDLEMTRIAVVSKWLSFFSFALAVTYF